MTIQLVFLNWGPLWPHVAPCVVTKAALPRPAPLSGPCLAKETRPLPVGMFVLRDLLASSLTVHCCWSDGCFPGAGQVHEWMMGMAETPRASCVSRATALRGAHPVSPRVAVSPMPEHRAVFPRARTPGCVPPCQNTGLCSPVPDHRAVSPRARTPGSHLQCAAGQLAEICPVSILCGWAQTPVLAGS